MPKKTSKKLRPIDVTAKETLNWWSKTYVFVNKTKIRTLHGTFVLAFIAGIAGTLFWTISNDYHPFSKAEEYVSSTKCVVEPGGGDFAEETKVYIRCGADVLEAYYQWNNSSDKKAVSFLGDGAGVVRFSDASIFEAKQNQTLTISYSYLHNYYSKSLQKRADEYRRKIEQRKQIIKYAEARIENYKKIIPEYKMQIAKYSAIPYAGQSGYQNILNEYQRKLKSAEDAIPRDERWIQKEENQIIIDQEKLDRLLVQIRDGVQQVVETYEFRAVEKAEDVQADKNTEGDYFQDDQSSADDVLGQAPDSEQSSNQVVDQEAPLAPRVLTAGWSDDMPKELSWKQADVLAKFNLKSGDHKAVIKSINIGVFSNLGLGRNIYLYGRGPNGSEVLLESKRIDSQSGFGFIAFNNFSPINIANLSSYNFTVKLDTFGAGKGDFFGVTIFPYGIVWSDGEGEDIKEVQGLPFDIKYFIKKD